MKILTKNKSKYKMSLKENIKVLTMTKAKEEKKSFFDGMEEFETNEIIGMDALEKVADQSPPLYTKEDLASVKKIAKD